MNNPICLNSNTYHGFTLEEAVEGAHRVGIKLIELTGRQWLDRACKK